MKYNSLDELQGNKNAYDDNYQGYTSRHYATKALDFLPEDIARDECKIVKRDDGYFMIVQKKEYFNLQ